jgi:hypothetical protein
VDAPELVLAGEDLRIRVATADGSRQPLRITIVDEAGRVVEARAPAPTGGTSTTTVRGLPPGAYGITVAGIRGGSPVAPVSGDVLVWGYGVSQGCRWSGR